MYRILIVLGTGFLFAGCVGGEPDPLPATHQGEPSPATAEGQPPQTPPGDSGLPTIPVSAQAPVPQDSEIPASQGENENFTTTASEPGMERIAAQAGVGKKGQGYGGGIITEPISAYFKTRDRMAFGIQIPHAMKLFQAEHNRYPKDMAEFERVILQPAQIVLPELPEGHKYVFDPTQVDIANGETGLMVERPSE